MYNIIERKAGDFIDLDNYFNSMSDNTDLISNFYLLLIGRIPNENECVTIIGDYAKEILEIKESYEFIYNPPALPSNLDEKPKTIGDEYRKEFAEMYGGYVELVYLICQSFKYKPFEVLEMKVQDFLFWGNYLLHKKYVENIK